MNNPSVLQLILLYVVVFASFAAGYLASEYNQARKADIIARKRLKEADKTEMEDLPF
tara:strand:+ start:149 stop:319 length:171 start_codon:yes stop_codon:yes gene_type:complete